MAWLAATPEKKQETRAEEYERRFGPYCPELDLPEIWGGEHIVEYLFELGPTVKGEEISHPDIGWWQENTGAVVDEFEATMLVALSRAYIAQYRRSSGKSCSRPWSRPFTQEERNERIRQQVEARKARKKLQEQQHKK